MKYFSCSGPATQPASYGALDAWLSYWKKNQILPWPEVKNLSFVHRLLCHFFGALQEDESLGEMNMEKAWHPGKRKIGIMNMVRTWEEKAKEMTRVLILPATDSLRETN